MEDGGVRAVRLHPIHQIRFPVSLIPPLNRLPHPLSNSAFCRNQWILKFNLAYKVIEEKIFSS
jgi:hypothetical protein